MEFDWRYLLNLATDEDFWSASVVVIWLSLLTFTLATFSGFFVALARTTGPAWLKAIAGIYTWFFRSLPLLVLIIFVYNLPQLLPWTRPVLSNPFLAGLFAMIVSETAYIAEIHRGGLLSIDKGQHEAAHALGLTKIGEYRYIIIPQSFRVALPALGNQFVTIVKLTSLVSVISLSEILLVGQRLYTRNFLVIETLIAVSIYYVVIVSVFSRMMGFLESWLDVSRRPGQESDEEVFLERREALPANRRIDDRVVLKLENVSKRFGKRTVLDGVSLSVHAGEVVSLIGPSGSGKTTLIRTINALQDFDQGGITFNGGEWISSFPNYHITKDFGQKVTQLGMVFQSFNLFPHMTVIENIMLAPKCHRQVAPDRASSEAMKVLGKVAMSAHAEKYPYQLSGGQKQRIAIARALAMNPRVMLFDEPTSALDPELVDEVLVVIERLAAEGMTMIIVTHEMRFASRVSDRVVMLEQGRIVSSLSRDELRVAPANSRIRQFMDRGAFK